MTRRRIFVSRDAGAIAVGADRVTAAVAEAAKRASLPIEIVRTGSRGAYWLEPLVEVETPRGRVGYGPVAPEDVPGLFACGLLDGGPHERSLGETDSIPWLKRQTRLMFSRCGITDPLSLDDYRAHAGGKGLARALALGPEDIVKEIARSGLRGRGGAGFPTGIKWRTTAEAKGTEKYVVCNADEGDSGTFADRMLMEGDPFLLIEGMSIAGIAVGATKGVIYCRSEYPNAIATMIAALKQAREAGLHGTPIADSRYDFDIELCVGAGSYVCGEETALLESVEGKRGQVRAKPPLPAHAGLYTKPTVVNNVLTFAAAAWILAEGGDAYHALGYGRSRGTMPIQLAGNVKYPGLFETPFGITLGGLIDNVGGGTASGRPVRAVQAGGPLGAYFPRALFDTPYDYEAFTERAGLIGHGGLVVFDDTVDMARQARFAMEFCAFESCGKCTPCRVGSVRGVEVIDRIVKGENRAANAALLRDLCETLKWGSLCALGGFTPYPVLSALNHFPEDFGLARKPAEV
ncbi:MAG TPA: NADH-ubiquinone oxidoreductase-F iron-sulfur binding region domain-containing protein [Rhizomicrobium sp.]|jgi:formate dehydrogenase iron-sulfur subunit|nr:NADH-ubiquinone oxidoreductase-F iron-sulfur binding region domain-containing protein [Rhizomicrobium sp.]